MLLNCQEGQITKSRTYGTPTSRNVFFALALIHRHTNPSTLAAHPLQHRHPRPPATWHSGKVLGLKRKLDFQESHHSSPHFPWKEQLILTFFFKYGTLKLANHFVGAGKTKPLAKARVPCLHRLNVSQFSLSQPITESITPVPRPWTAMKMKKWSTKTSNPWLTL